MTIQLNRYPNGTHLACTMSMDDGRIYDRKVVELFNQYGLKGTFHLNSGKLDTPDYLSSREIRGLFKGHEISLHTLNHYHLSHLARPTVLKEILEDKRILEKLAGYPIRGMSLPFGDYDKRVVDLLMACGVEYFRTVVSTGKFNLPDNLPEWHPTIHIKKPEPELIQSFIHNPFEQMKLLYVWSHSYEFNDNNTWDMIEDFCKEISSHKNIWFATNIEIKDYLDALKMLVVSEDETMIFNPSGMEVCVSVNGNPVYIPARTQKNFQNL